ncbi:hypothetical protein OIDMADRAFT_17417, partial [Oidiodendron maius Zn]
LQTWFRPTAGRQTPENTTEMNEFFLQASMQAYIHISDSMPKFFTNAPRVLAIC